MAKGTELLIKYGPAKGYFPEPSKSILICKADDQAAAQVHLQPFEFKYLTGGRYVGGFIGAPDALADWLTPKVTDWVAGVSTLAKIARKYPKPRMLD